MKKHNIVGGLILVFCIVPLIFFLILLLSHDAEILEYSVAHPVLAPVILVLWRVLGVVIPPIPGGVLSFALIPVLGWFPSFIYSTLGLLIGACLAFFLARKFREPLVKKFVPLQQMQQWEGKVSGSTELWTFIAIRFTTGPIMDFISYLAGLSKLSFGKFLFATVLSLLPSAITFYLGATAYAKLADESPYLGVAIFTVLVILYGLFYKKIIKHKNKSRVS